MLLRADFCTGFYGKYTYRIFIIKNIRSPEGNFSKLFEPRILISLTFFKNSVSLLVGTKGLRNERSSVKLPRAPLLFVTTFSPFHTSQDENWNATVTSVKTQITFARPPATVSRQNPKWMAWTQYNIGKCRNEIIKFFILKLNQTARGSHLKIRHYIINIKLFKNRI